MLKRLRAATFSVAILASAVGVVFAPDAFAADKSHSPAPNAPQLAPMVEYTRSFIDGLWESDWGPLTFVATQHVNGTFNLTGYWIQSGRKGIIKRGNFDPSAGILRFEYYQFWNDVNGQAAFRLSADKRVLSGNWKQSNNTSGTWVLQRPGSWRLASPPVPSGAALPPVKALPPVAVLPPVKALPPVAALPPGGAMTGGGGGNVTVIPVPGAAGGGGIEMKHEGCRLRLSVGSDMLFDFDKSDLTAEAVKTLDVLGPVVKDFATHPVTIEGHTDSIGSDEYNQGLSERRAKSVKDWLANRNFVSTTASDVGFGEKQPIAPNTTSDGADNPSGRARNRRVEIVVDTCLRIGQDGASFEVDEAGLKTVLEKLDSAALRGDAYYVMGMDLMRRNQWEQAASAFQQGLSVNPDDSRTHTKLGRSYLELNKNKEAIDELQLAIKLNPDDKEAAEILKATLARESKPQAD